MSIKIEKSVEHISSLTIKPENLDVPITIYPRKEIKGFKPGEMISWHEQFAGIEATLLSADILLTIDKREAHSFTTISKALESTENLRILFSSLTEYNQLMVYTYLLTQKLKIYDSNWQ